MTEQTKELVYEPYVETRTGKKFTFLDPKLDDIDINDIAFALANQCRFNGHCSSFYSVAEHSVAVAMLLPKELQLAGLLHDAGEAYLGDIPSPIKQFLPDYDRLEAKVATVIYEKFGVTLDATVEAAVKQADLQQLRTEATFLIPSKGDDWDLWERYPEIQPEAGHRPMCAPPIYAFKAFLHLFNALTEPTEAPIILAA